MKVLFLSENPLPRPFVRGAVFGKELRLRGAIDEVESVYGLSLPGWAMVKPGKRNQQRGKWEKKVTILWTCRWPYYLSSIILFVYGLYYVWKLKPDVIEAESPLWSGPAAVVLGTLFGIPTIVEVRSSFHDLATFRLAWLPSGFVRKVVDLIYMFSVRGADTVIANSEYYKHFLQERGVASVEINPGLHYPPPVTIDSKTRVAVVGYIGRLVPEKGVDILLDAMVLLRKRGIDLELKIGGAGRSMESLVEKMKSLDLEEQVEFLGLVDPYLFLASVDVAVNPILVPTPLEMVNVESAYMGVPMICFDHDGLPNTVEDMVSGVRVPDHSPQGLAKSIEILSANVDQFNSMRLSAHKWALKNYGFALQVQRLVGLYRGLGLLV